MERKYRSLTPNELDDMEKVVAFLSASTIGTSIVVMFSGSLFCALLSTFFLMLSVEAINWYKEAKQFENQNSNEDEN